MPSHQGEIAFPGGKREPRATPTSRAAALREAHEEIGLEPGSVEIVAELDRIGTVASRFTIAPFVGLLAGRPSSSRPARGRRRVFDVPLSVSCSIPTSITTSAGTTWPDLCGRPGARWSTSSSCAGETVWGATARILTGFLHPPRRPLARSPHGT